MRWLLLSAVLLLGGCFPEPTRLSPAEVADIVGTYRAENCPDIEITPQEMIAGPLRTEIKFIQLKLDWTIEAKSYIRLTFGQQCRFDRAKGPVYIFVRRSGRDISFDMPDMSLSRQITYRKISGPPTR